MVLSLFLKELVLKQVALPAQHFSWWGFPRCSFFCPCLIPHFSNCFISSSSYRVSPDYGSSAQWCHCPLIPVFGSSLLSWTVFLHLPVAMPPGSLWLLPVSPDRDRWPFGTACTSSPCTGSLPSLCLQPLKAVCCPS